MHYIKDKEAQSKKKERKKQTVGATIALVQLGGELKRGVLKNRGGKGVPCSWGEVKKGVVRRSDRGGDGGWGNKT